MEAFEDRPSLPSSEECDDLYSDRWMGGESFFLDASSALSSWSSGASSFILRSLSKFKYDSLKASSSYRLLLRFLALKVISSSMDFCLICS